MTNKPWPNNGQTVSFQDMVKPIVDAISFAYQLQRQNKSTDIPWSGLDIGNDLKATCFNPDERLSAEQLNYSNEDQGRTALEEIVGIAVQLGMEQGRRHFITERMRFWILHLQMGIHDAVGQKLKELSAEFLEEE